MVTLKVKVEFLEDALGTASANPDLHREYIASNAPDAKKLEEEVASLGAEEVFEKGMTVFSRNEDGNPIVWDYQWKGYFKDACGMLRNATGSVSSKLTAYKKKIDGLVFLKERKVPLILPEGADMGECQRPLRADTPQGPRVALAYSETVPAGTTQEFTVVLLKDDMEKVLREWLDYGFLHGTGQWRNSGKGRFTVEYL